MTEPHARHPSDEILAAYLSTGLTSAEQRDVRQHVQTCDRCVQTVAIARSRMDIASELSAPVPASVRERARLPEFSPARDGDAHPHWLSAWRDRLTGLLRIPVLAPVAVAVGMLLVLATNSQWLHPGGELTRSIHLRQTVHVTSTEAPVHAQPSTRADVVATLHHGTAVEVRDEQRDWYRVALPDGTEGWVLRDAFE